MTTRQDRERLDQRTNRALANKISALIIKGNMAEYELGEVVEKVIREKRWRDWLGVSYRSFDAWCWQILGFKRRKAQYLSGNYTSLSGMNLSDDTLARALRLGWTKLAHVLRLASGRPPEGCPNIETSLLHWIDRVEDEGLTEEDLRAERALMRTGDPDEGEIPSDDDDEGGSGSSSGGGSGTRARRIKFPITFVKEDDLRIFVRSLKLIRERVNPEMSYGEAAALMATTYLGVAARDDEGGLAVELDTIIQAVEATHNVRLKLDDDQPPARVFGDDGGDDDADAALDGFF